MVTDNVDSRGRLHTDKYAAAMLAYRNSILYPKLGRSIAQTLLGRYLRETLPSPRLFYEPGRKFVLDRQDREASLAKRNTEMLTCFLAPIPSPHLPTDRVKICQF